MHRVLHGCAETRQHFPVASSSRAAMLRACSLVSPHRFYSFTVTQPCARAPPAGGLNFDAKLRRESTSVEDLVLAHIA